MTLIVKAWATFEGNLPDAERIFNRRGTETLNDLGRFLKGEAQTLVKRFSGEEARTLKVQVSGARLNKFVEIFGELVQHYVDEYGLPPGTFPPWDIGTRVFNWTSKKGLRLGNLVSTPQKTRRVSHVTSRRPKAARAKLAGDKNQGSGGAHHRRRIRQARRGANRSARAISKERETRRVSFIVARGIFERGIRANRWATRLMEQNRVRIIRDLQRAFSDAVAEINS